MIYAFQMFLISVMRWLLLYYCVTDANHTNCISFEKIYTRETYLSFPWKWCLFLHNVEPLLTFSSSLILILPNVRVPPFPLQISPPKILSLFQKVSLCKDYSTLSWWCLDMSCHVYYSFLFFLCLSPLHFGKGKEILQRNKKWKKCPDNTHNTKRIADVVDTHLNVTKTSE